MSNKKTVHLFLIVALVLMASIVFFNYKIDIFNLYGKNSNNSIITDLYQKYYVSSENITSNRVDNIYDKLLYLKKAEKIDVLAIGSSRTMLLHKESIFKNQKVNYLNFTDGTANLNHYAKVIGLFNKHSIEIPKTIILGLDPWVFDTKTTITKVKNLINVSSDFSDSHYCQLFNYEYTKMNFLSLFKQANFLKSKSLEQLLNNKNSHMILSPNGDIFYPPAKENIDIISLKKDIEKGIKKCKETNYNTKCVNYNVLKNINEFRYILKYLKERGCKIIIYLPPFAPTFYSYIMKNNNFQIHYNKILEILKDENLILIGSYNPNDLNLLDLDFLDSIHLKNISIHKIFKNLKIEDL